jgi:predicted small metal-binding protein
MRELNCGEATGLDCQEVIRGDTDEDVMSQAAAHAASAHGMTDIDDATQQQLRSMIHDA